VGIDKFKIIFNKIPIGLLSFLYVAYLSVSYYAFENDSSSPKVLKKNQISELHKTETVLQKKIKDLTQFAKILDEKKGSVRELAIQLQDVKNSLPETINIPDFMKSILIEAKILNLSLSSFTPAGIDKKEYFSEIKFTLDYRGAFVQLLAFLQRLSNLSRITQIGKADFKRKMQVGKFVLLEGQIELKTFQYTGTIADSLGKSDVKEKSKE
jgi:Tfp pilus assembly protein PilO